MTYKETYAWKAVSVVTAIATIVTLSGVVYLTQVLNVFAAGEEAVVEDVTGTSPRIAPAGESERVALGVNIVGPETQTTLTEVNVHLTSDDSAAEAAASNIETVRIYRDSSLSGTNGVFDSSDALLTSVTRTDSTSPYSGLIDGAQGAGATFVLVDGATNPPADAAAVTVKLGTGTEAHIMAGTFYTDASAANAGDCGTAGTAAQNCIDVTGTTAFALSDNAAVREVNATATTDGFAAYSAGVAVDITTSFVIPKDDAGTNAGNDLFVVLVTADGADNQTVKVQVWTNDLEEDANAIAVSSASGTTDGTTKSITFGGDGVAPTITKVETYDNTADGIVDQVKVYFSESMASTLTDTGNFVNALGGTAHMIEAGGTDIDLETAASWSTTTVLNDTLTIDFADVNHSDAAQSTGDSWTVVYDQDFEASNALKDATGEEMLDQSVTTTDMAKPYPMSAKLKDLNGNNKVDSLEVTFSETLGSATTSGGFTLKVGSTTYTLGAVTGFKKFDSTTVSNSNDTVIIAVTENSSNDVTSTFTLDYAASGGVVDVAGNSANAITGITPTVSVVPVPMKAEYKDSDGDGQIDSLEITFSRAVTNTGGADADLELGWTLSEGYSLATTGHSGTTTTMITLVVTESLVSDSGKTPDATYSTTTGTLFLSGGTLADDPVANVTSAGLNEADKASPLLESATLYETTANDIWEAGETVQLFFSEAVDASTVASSWSLSGADGSVWTDWRLENADGTAVDDAEVPDSGTVSVNGRVVTLTASVDATQALAGDGTGTGGDQFSVVANEVKDSAGNSATPQHTSTIYDGGAVELTVTPGAAPSLVNIQTRDMNGNGIVDALVAQFDGLVDASTLVAGDFAAVRGASYSSTTETSPDLTITSVMTANGGNDTMVVVKFAEQNEDTGALPKLKYVQGSLADLAGNLVATFNAGTDTAKFEAPVTTDSVDGAAPIVVHKLLRDRNSNGMYDQLVLVFSEAMGTGTDTDGWTVSGESLAQTGAWSANDGTYDAYTFASTANVFKADILETDAPDSVPSVSYASTGAFKDAGRNALPLANVSAGGEVSEVSVAPPAPVFADGDLVREAGSDDVYIVKLVGVKKFKRLIINPAIFNSYGHLEWANIQDVVAGSLDGYTLSDMIRELNGEKVYKVSSALDADTGTKQWLNMTPSTFESCGHDWDSLYIVNSSEVSDSFYPIGADITSC
ncbi:MAG: hypothetical protein WDZ40_01765 [Candidatus Spechtbacterales bacterium]